MTTNDEEEPAYVARLVSTGLTEAQALDYIDSRPLGELPPGVRTPSVIRRYKQACFGPDADDPRTKTHHYDCETRTFIAPEDYPEWLERWHATQSRRRFTP